MENLLEMVTNKWTSSDSVHTLIHRSQPPVKNILSSNGWNLTANTFLPCPASGAKTPCLKKKDRWKEADILTSIFKPLHLLNGDYRTNYCNAVFWQPHPLTSWFWLPLLWGTGISLFLAQNSNVGYQICHRVRDIAAYWRAVVKDRQGLLHKKNHWCQARDWLFF